MFIQLGDEWKENKMNRWVGQADEEMWVGKQEINLKIKWLLTGHY